MAALGPQITGAINDEGGGPTWTDQASYTAPNTMTSGGVAAASKQSAGQGTGRWFHCRTGARTRPVPLLQLHRHPDGAQGADTGLTTVYAVHTLAAQKGDIFIAYAGTYNFTENPITITLPSGSKYEVQPLTAGPRRHLGDNRGDRRLHRHSRERQR